MFFVGIIGLIIALIAFVISLLMAFGSKDFGGVLAVACIIMLVATGIVGVASIRTVDAGETIVVTNSPNNELVGTTLNGGWHWNPGYILSSMETIKYNTRAMEFVGDDDMANDDAGSIQVLSKDNLAIQVDFAIIYDIPYDNVSNIRFTYGADFERNVIVQIGRSVPRDVCAQFNASDIIGQQRGIVEQQIQTGIISAMNDYGFRVSEVALRDIRPPESMMNAIEEKKVAEQSVITAEYNKQRITIEAEAEKTRIMIEASADAQAQILKANGSAEAIRTVLAQFYTGDDNATMTNYLTWMYIQALCDPNSNVQFVIVPSDGSTPILISPNNNNGNLVVA